MNLKASLSSFSSGYHILLLLLIFPLCFAQFWNHGEQSPIISSDTNQNRTIPLSPTPSSSLLTTLEVDGCRIPSCVPICFPTCGCSYNACHSDTGAMTCCDPKTEHCMDIGPLKGTCCPVEQACVDKCCPLGRQCGRSIIPFGPSRYGNCCEIGHSTCVKSSDCGDKGENQRCVFGCCV